MAVSSVVSYADPELYQAAIRPEQVEVLVTKKGDFRAELTRIELPQIWLQSGRENVPRVCRSAVSAKRPPFFFLASADQPAVRHSGKNVSFGEIIAVGPGSTHHVRTEAPCHWANLSLPRDGFAAAARTLLGYDLTLPSATHRLRPSTPVMARLLNLHEAARRLAESQTDILAQPEPARALQQAILHAIIMCFSESAPAQTHAGRHLEIVARFEDFLAAHHEDPLYLAEVCAAIGVSERTLRVSCNEHLGMGPVRYLLFRRMHMAHRALILADPAVATVTKIAMDHGFWEFGRFAVSHRALFGGVTVSVIAPQAAQRLADIARAPVHIATLRICIAAAAASLDSTGSFDRTGNSSRHRAAKGDG